MTGLFLDALLHRYACAHARHVVENAERERGFRLRAGSARDILFRYRIEPARGFEYVSPSVEAALAIDPSTPQASLRVRQSLLGPVQTRSRLASAHVCAGRR